MNVENTALLDSVCHFTYKEPANTAQLCQGDVLYKSSELIEVLDQIHPHYLKDDYTHFIILTQTCDLVPRSGKYKTRYIVLAAVRPLDTVIEREISNCQRSDVEQVGFLCSDKNRSKMFEFVSSLMNNNKDEYFYLHDDATFDFIEPSCAFLKLAISLRTEDHYQKCLDARKFALEENFRAKLGYNLSHLYSRVGTQDWVPENKSKADFTKIVNQYLERTYDWIEEKRLQAVLASIKESEASRKLVEEAKEKIGNEEVSEDDFLDAIDSVRGLVKNTKLEKPIDVVAQKIISILLNEMKIDITQKNQNKIVQFIKSDQIIKKNVKG